MPFLYILCALSCPVLSPRPPHTSPRLVHLWPVHQLINYRCKAREPAPSSAVAVAAAALIAVAAHCRWLHSPSSISPSNSLPTTYYHTLRCAVRRAYSTVTPCDTTPSSSFAASSSSSSSSKQSCRPCAESETDPTQRALNGTGGSLYLLLARPSFVSRHQLIESQSVRERRLFKPKRYVQPRLSSA